ncbi:hypothetical protein Tco_0889732 [Tanacetum coccineum]
MGKEASCYRTSCRTCSRLISGAKRCVATSSYRCVDRESKEFEFVTEEIIEEGIVDQISRMKTSQCDENCSKAIERIAKEYQVRSMGLVVVVLD